MDLIQRVILGLVEDAIEFIPVSSTDHLIVCKFPLTESNRAFEVIIQLIR
ncbi:MAG: hypothetical protein WBM99_10835 [Psychromonas sp.]